jgi:hypothetical protein
MCPFWFFKVKHPLSLDITRKFYATLDVTPDIFILLLGSFLYKIEKLLGLLKNMTTKALLSFHTWTAGNACEVTFVPLGKSPVVRLLILVSFSIPFCPKILSASRYFFTCSSEVNGGFQLETPELSVIFTVPSDDREFPRLSVARIATLVLTVAVEGEGAWAVWLSDRHFIKEFTDGKFPIVVSEKPTGTQNFLSEEGTFPEGHVPFAVGTIPNLSKSTATGLINSVHLVLYPGANI